MIVEVVNSHISKTSTLLSPYSKLADIDSPVSLFTKLVKVIVFLLSGPAILAPPGSGPVGSSFIFLHNLIAFGRVNSVFSALSPVLGVNWFDALAIVSGQGNDCQLKQNGSMLHVVD